jgi:Type II restriction endonuclease EcoO109I
MEKLNLKDINNYVEKNIGSFHKQRLESLNNLKLAKILKRKNPYLFKTKNVLTSEQIIKGILDAHISSNEETIFGDWLEGLAIFINSKIYGGRKSGIPGIDLEFDKNKIRYIITIKSGPNWGNSSQVKKMVTDFNSARKTLRTSNSTLHVIAINGCCYGNDNNPDKNGVYYKYCGQEFWAFISGDTELYIKLIEPLGHKAKERNEEFLKSYSRIINKFTLEFSNQFCSIEGDIDWKKLVQFNSGKTSHKK